MIKNSTHIRKFTPKQRQLLELVAEAKKLKTVPDILFFALENYIEQEKEIARLKRIIEYKQKKIVNLTTEKDASISVTSIQDQNGHSHQARI